MIFRVLLPLGFRGFVIETEGFPAFPFSDKLRPHEERAISA